MRLILLCLLGYAVLISAEESRPATPVLASLKSKVQKSKVRFSDAEVFALFQTPPGTWGDHEIMTALRVYYGNLASNMVDYTQAVVPATLTGANVVKAWIQTICTYLAGARKPTDIDKPIVIVAGLGPAGLSAAIETLKSKRYHFRLYEKRCDFIREYPVDLHTGTCSNAGTDVGGNNKGMQTLIAALGIADVGAAFKYAPTYIEQNARLVPIAQPRIALHQLQRFLLACFMIASGVNANMGVTVTIPRDGVAGVITTGVCTVNSLRYPTMQDAMNTAIAAAILPRDLTTAVTVPNLAMVPVVVPVVEGEGEDDFLQTALDIAFKDGKSPRQGSKLVDHEGAFIEEQESVGATTKAPLPDGWKYVIDASGRYDREMAVINQPFEVARQHFGDVVYAVYLFKDGNGAICEALRSRVYRANRALGIEIGMVFRKVYKPTGGETQQCLFEIPFKLKEGMKVWRLMNDHGHAWLWPHSATTVGTDEGIKRLRFMYLLAKLLDATAPSDPVATRIFAAGILIECKFYRNSFQMVSTALWVVDKGNGKTIVSIGDSIRPAYPQFAMGVNDAHYQGWVVAGWLNADAPDNSGLLVLLTAYEAGTMVPAIQLAVYNTYYFSEMQDPPGGGGGGGDRWKVALPENIRTRLTSRGQWAITREDLANADPDEGFPLYPYYCDGQLGRQETVEQVLKGTLFRFAWDTDHCTLTYAAAAAWEGVEPA